MEVEVDKDASLSLVLVEGQVLVFSGNLLKYIEIFKNAYDAGYSSFKEAVNYQLRYNLWRLVLSYLAEYDKTGLINNSWSKSFGMIEQLERYEVVRLSNYYGIPLVTDMVLTWTIEALLTMPRLSLHLTHPLVQWNQPLPQFKSLDKHALKMDSPFAKINKEYAMRRHEIMAICQRYIQTMDLLVVIERDFLPPISASILGVHKRYDSMVISTAWGIATLGENSYGQLGTGVKGATLFQIERSLRGDGLTTEQIKNWRTERLMRGEWVGMLLMREASIISVTVGTSHTIINTTFGLFGCGHNNEGQLGIPVRDGDDNVFLEPNFLNIHNILLVGCGASHTLAYSRKGLFATGDNTWGQLGLKDSDYEQEGFILVPFNEPLAAIACAGVISFLLTKSKQVYRSGQFMSIEADKLSVFTPLVTKTPIIAIAAADNYALFLDEAGLVYVYQPKNDDDESPAEKDIDAWYTLYPINSLPPIVHVVAHEDGTSFFIDRDANVYSLDVDSLDKVPLQIPIPHKVITVTRIHNVYYFVTCDGLFVRRGDENTFHPIPLTLTDVPLCLAPSYSGTTQEKYPFACHQCGETNYASLAYHKTSQHIFCHTKACLSLYKRSVY